MEIRFVFVFIIEQLKRHRRKNFKPSLCIKRFDPTACQALQLLASMTTSNKQKHSRKENVILFDQLSQLMNELKCFLCLAVLWLISYEDELIFCVACSSFMRVMMRSDCELHSWESHKSAKTTRL